MNTIIGAKPSVLKIYKYSHNKLQPQISSICCAHGHILAILFSITNCPATTASTLNFLIHLSIPPYFFSCHYVSFACLTMALLAQEPGMRLQQLIPTIVLNVMASNAPSTPFNQRHYDVKIFFIEFSLEMPPSLQKHACPVNSTELGRCNDRGGRFITQQITIALKYCLYGSKAFIHMILIQSIQCEPIQIWCYVTSTSLHNICDGTCNCTFL